MLSSSYRALIMMMSNIWTVLNSTVNVEKGDKRYVEDTEETTGRRVMLRIQIRFNQVPVRSDLIPFSLRFVIGISSFYCSYGAITGNYPVKTHLLARYVENTHFLSFYPYFS
jgi:hypothetical protein